jgi:ATP-binding cassette subfamily A (ABC1) protein 3
MNGAGKTTTLDILTGQQWATSGHAYINGRDIVSSSSSSSSSSLGLCPQYDYLPEYLTVRESLELFANLRQVSSSVVQRVVDEYLQMFRLTEYEHKLVQVLSGGTKRKVSAALAFIGNPSTVILDEPTSGMDPAARHYMWSVIRRARDNGATILLTTHR